MAETPRTLIAGNWKMNGLRAEAESLVRGLAGHLAAGAPARCEVLVCPPATLLSALAEALAHARAEGDRALLGPILTNLGVIAARNRQFESASGYFEEAVEMARADGNRRVMAFLYTNMGALAHDQGHKARAEREFDSALSLSREMGDSQRMSHVLASLGALATARREFDTAESYLSEGLNRARAANLKENEVLLLINSAEMQRELEAGIDNLSSYRNFADQAAETKRKLLQFLIEAKRQGKKVVGYGAPGKATTLLNYCGVRTDMIDYLVDRNPYKHGRYMPGVRIPIYEPERIEQTRPDYIVILPWNLKDEISEQLAYAREWGAQFVVPIPEVQVF